MAVSEGGMWYGGFLMVCSAFDIWTLFCPQAHSQHVLHRVDGKSPGGLMTAYSTIQFIVQKHHFIRGKIKVTINYLPIFYLTTVHGTFFRATVQLTIKSGQNVSEGG